MELEGRIIIFGKGDFPKGDYSEMFEFFIMSMYHVYEKLIC